MTNTQLIPAGKLFFQKPIWLYSILGCTIVVISIGSLGVGSAIIPFREVINSFFGQAEEVATTIVMEIRLPRLILSLSVGAILAMAGAVLQGYLRNPLAEASILGASNSAALGAVLALYFGLAASFSFALPLMAVLASLVALGAVLMLARWSESPLTLVLAGIAISTLAGSAISLALNLTSNPFAILEMTFWLLGSLEDRSMAHVFLALPLIFVGAVLLMWDVRALDALTLGEDAASSLGFDLGHVRLRLVAGVAFGVGGAVAVSGAIGFIGLVVPHIMRGVVGYQPSRLIVPSAFAGAILLTCADIVVRLIPSTSELKLGVVTSLLGVPVFLYLLFQSRRVW